MMMTHLLAQALLQAGGHGCQGELLLVLLPVLTLWAALRSEEREGREV